MHKGNSSLIRWSSLKVPRITVIIPALNESGNIRQLVHDVQASCNLQNCRISPTRMSALQTMSEELLPENRLL